MLHQNSFCPFYIVPLAIADEYNQRNVKLQRKTMNIEETLDWYKSWVAEHPQVSFPLVLFRIFIKVYFRIFSEYIPDFQYFSEFCLKKGGILDPRVPLFYDYVFKCILVTHVQNIQKVYFINHTIYETYLINHIYMKYITSTTFI